MWCHLWTILFFSQAEEEEKRRRKNGTTFQVGSLAVRNDIFDELLNERKLELLLDPGREIWIYRVCDGFRITKQDDYFELSSIFGGSWAAFFKLIICLFDFSYTV